MSEPTPQPCDSCETAAGVYLCDLCGMWVCGQCEFTLSCEPWIDDDDDDDEASP